MESRAVDEMEKKMEENVKKEKKEYTQFSEYLSQRAELKVREKIEEGMKGRPGLLIGNFKSEKHLYENLSKLLGFPIVVPNCDEKHHQPGEDHKEECYRMETDFILLYPDRDKLAIRLIEVKRPNSVPWIRLDFCDLNLN